MALRVRPSQVKPGHPDFDLLDRIRSAILAKVGGEEKMRRALPVLIRDAIDFVIDPVRTARTRIHDLDNVEKTFVGLKVEHYFRDLLDVPKGVRDLKIDDLNVDVKNTVGTTYLNAPNRDQKRSVSSGSFEHILWIVDGMQFPVSRWADIDMLRFRELRKMKRLRGNGGARDLLRLEGISLLSGAYDAERVASLGLATLGRDEMMAVADPPPKP